MSHFFHSLHCGLTFDARDCPNNWVSVTVAGAVILALFLLLIAVPAVLAASHTRRRSHAGSSGSGAGRSQAAPGGEARVGASAERSVEQPLPLAIPDGEGRLPLAPADPRASVYVGLAYRRDEEREEMLPRLAHTNVLLTGGDGEVVTRVLAPAVSLRASPMVAVTAGDRLATLAAPVVAAQECPAFWWDPTDSFAAPPSATPVRWEVLDGVTGATSASRTAHRLMTSAETAAGIRPESVDPRATTALAAILLAAKFSSGNSAQAAEMLGSEPWLWRRAVTTLESAVDAGAWALGGELSSVIASADEWRDSSCRQLYGDIAVAIGLGAGRPGTFLRPLYPRLMMGSGAATLFLVLPSHEGKRRAASIAAGVLLRRMVALHEAMEAAWPPLTIAVEDIDVNLPLADLRPLLRSAHEARIVWAASMTGSLPGTGADPRERRRLARHGWEATLRLPAADGSDLGVLQAVDGATVLLHLPRFDREPWSRVRKAAVGAVGTAAIRRVARSMA